MQSIQSMMVYLDLGLPNHAVLFFISVKLAALLFSIWVWRKPNHEKPKWIWAYW
jgi:hypothetical protein